MSTQPKLQKIYESVQYRELINRIRFLIYATATFVILTNIVAPGVNLEVWRQFITNQGTIFTFFGIFTGGALYNFSIISLGIIPYIDAAIIMQLLIASIPQLKSLQKDYGEEGRKKINFYTKWLAIAIATLQSFFAVSAINKANPAVFANNTFIGLLTVVVSLIAGSVFIMWLADQINEKGIGNGSSVIIFISILFRLPSYILETFNIGQSPINIIIIAAVQIFFFLLFIAVVSFLSLSIRKIPIMLTQRIIAGNKLVQQKSTFLPLPLISAGVLPIIFAVALLYFPITILQSFGVNQETFSTNPVLKFLYQTIVPPNLVIPTELNPEILKTFLNTLGWNIWHSIVYASLIILFSYFYTFIVINVDDLTDYLNKSGAVIRGIKPGQSTKNFLENTLYRLAFIGGLALSMITILPPYIMYFVNFVVSKITGIQELSLGGLVGLYISGSSMLIIVGVVLDILKQMNAYLIAVNPREVFRVKK
ncbi:MAG: preprotein translocase subunit SecY [bacterium]